MGRETSQHLQKLIWVPHLSPNTVNWHPFGRTKGASSAHITVSSKYRIFFPLYDYDEVKVLERDMIQDHMWNQHRIQPSMTADSQLCKLIFKVIANQVTLKFGRLDGCLLHFHLPTPHSLKSLRILQEHLVFGGDSISNEYQLNQLYLL